MKLSEHVRKVWADKDGGSDRSPIRPLVEGAEQLEARLELHTWREITDDNEPPRDVDLLLGWWRTWPERKWEYASGLYGSTKGGWVHGNATHWMHLPAPPAIQGRPLMNDAINAGTLLPCPFCGGSAAHYTSAESVFKAEWTGHVYHCTECQARVQNTDRRTAQEMWNTRPLRPAADALSPATEVRREAIALAARLEQVAKVMRSARTKSIPMEVWADDLKAVEDAILALPCADEAAIREKAFEDAAMIARQVAINAERRSADHTNLDAKQSALDKMAGAQEAEARIRAAEREKCAKIADLSVIADRSYALEYPDEAHKFDQRAHRGTTIAQAIRNGGKQP